MRRRTNILCSWRHRAERRLVVDLLCAWPELDVRVPEQSLPTVRDHSTPATQVAATHAGLGRRGSFRAPRPPELSWKQWPSPRVNVYILELSDVSWP